jgi:aspartyl-tRNA(Asn)/glutamyl-tRNA(Gln) amidotransferase subunit C
MSRVTEETVDSVARLARLSLTDEERRVFARQLGEILEYAESIQSLETEGVEPMSHAGDTSVFREGPARPGLDHSQAIDQAPDAADRLFRVPRVIG